MKLSDASADTAFNLMFVKMFKSKADLIVGAYAIYPAAH